VHPGDQSRILGSLRHPDPRDSMLDARADLRRNGIELVAFESSLYE